MWLFRLTVVSPLIPVYKMSVSFKQIYGNDLLKELFAENISANKLPHAMILEGAKGSGRYSFALHIAAASLCGRMETPCYTCKNCRQIFECVAPDVVTVALPEDKASIPVEAVRFIKNDAQKVPVEADFKFYIIRDADKMTVQAQNALLKILEEPPSFVVFILLSENSNLLLSTIRSRACIFRMERFEDESLCEYVLGKYPEAQKMHNADEAAFRRIIKSSNGSIGAVLDKLDKRSFAHAFDETVLIKNMLEALCSSKKADFIRYEDELPGKRDELRNSIFSVRNALRDLLAVKKGSVSDLVFFENADEIKAISNKLMLSSVASMIDAAESALNANEMNANVNLLKINFMNALWKCVH